MVSQANCVRINGTPILNNDFSVENSRVAEELFATVSNNDFIRVKAISEGNDNGSLEIATADGGNEPIYVRQYTGSFQNKATQITLIDRSKRTVLNDTRLGIGRAPTTGFELDVNGSALITNDLIAQQTLIAQPRNSTVLSEILSTKIECGRESGSAALTVNDGFGNASLTFNHAFGVSDYASSTTRTITNSSLTSDGYNVNFNPLPLPSDIVRFSTVYLSEYPNIPFSVRAINGPRTLLRIKGPNNEQIRVGGTFSSSNANVGSSARILSTVESSTASMRFQLGDFRPKGSAGSLTNILQLTTSENTFFNPTQFNERVYGSYFAAFRLEYTATNNRERLIAAKNILSVQFLSNNRIKINYANFVPETVSGNERIRYAHTGMARSDTNSGINIVGPQGQGNNNDDTSSGTSYAFYGSTQANAATYTTQDPRFISEVCIVVHYIPSNITNPDGNNNNTLNNNEIPTNIV